MGGPGGGGDDEGWGVWWVVGVGEGWNGNSKKSSGSFVLCENVLHSPLRGIPHICMSTHKDLRVWYLYTKLFITTYCTD
jgi:hypothetical protein